MNRQRLWADSYTDSMRARPDAPADEQAAVARRVADMALEAFDRRFPEPVTDSETPPTPEVRVGRRRHDLSSELVAAEE